MISQLVDGDWVRLTDEEHLAQCLAEVVAAGVVDPCPACFTARLDGVCKPCHIQAVYNADPDYRAWGDAQARLDFGEWAPDSPLPYTYDDAQADEAAVKRLSAKFNRAERDAVAEPGGCEVCGVPERGHARRWHGPQRPWTYIAPSIAARKARMVARRNSRLGLPAWAPLNLGGAA